MNESLKSIFAGFFDSKQAVHATNLEGNVTFWNKGSERLFGYTAEEVVGKQLPFKKELVSAELNHTLEQTAKGKDVCIRVTRKTKDNEIIDVITCTYPLLVEGTHLGFFSVTNEISKIRKAHNLNAPRDTKRTFVELRQIILSCLLGGRMTINQVSNKSGVNWKTVEKHLTFLIGKGYVDEVFSSEYVRIFELTEKGDTYVKRIQEESLSKLIKNDEDEMSYELHRV